MAGVKLTFHIPPEGKPDSVLPLIRLMADQNMTFDSVKELLHFTDEQGLGSRTEIQIFAAECGLLDKSQSKVQLSDVGRNVARLNTNTQPDIVHYLLYTGWQEEQLSKNTVLWSYKEISDVLWERSSVNVLEFSTRLVEEIHNRIRRTFIEVPDYERGTASFSQRSVRGARRWLEALTPPVVENNKFSRRHFCIPELMLLALGWIARMTNGETGTDLLLTPERREALCRLCLLEPNALDRSLDYMLPIYPEVLEEGTTAGVYGRFVHLKKWPELSDLF